MKRVTGIGGIFFKSKDPKALQEWYRKHLGIESDGEEGATFKWREDKDPAKEAWTQWTPFPQDTEYFEPTKVPFMINYRVDDLDALLAALREEGVAVSDKIESHDYGRFTWITDLEGNRVELWEPAKE